LRELFDRFAAQAALFPNDFCTSLDA